MRAGAAVPDVKVARAAQEAGIAGLSFMRGIPGGVGGALRMNGGAYGRETKDALVEARAVDRQGRVHVLSNADMRYAYRHCGAPDDYIFTQALVCRASAATRRPSPPRWKRSPSRARRRSRSRAAPAAPRSRIRRAKKPGSSSTPPAAAACAVGDAQVSEMHCNFLINLGNATAADIETLGETVRRRVKDNSGVELEWEIKRIGASRSRTLRACCSVA